jgi:hypothetical protein
VVAQWRAIGVNFDEKNSFQMKPTTIYITYNPKNGAEKTLAVRLHTIGAVNGFKMYLPDRYNSESELDAESQSRISRSEYVILFSMGSLSSIVKQEIQYAVRFGIPANKIIVIYDNRKGKNLTGDITNHFRQYNINPESDNIDEVLHSIVDGIFLEQQIKHHLEIENHQQKRILQLEIEKKQLLQQKENQQGLTALLGIGLGLFVLGALADSGDSKPKKSTRK